MKRLLKVLGALIGVVLLAAGSFVAYVAASGIPHYEPGKIELKVELTPARIARGKKFANVLCSECHMDPTTGKLAGKLMSDAPKEFGEIYSRNITHSTTKGIGGWTDGQLAYLFRTGITRDGRYIPPYMVKLPHLSDEDLFSIIAFLRSDDPMVQAVDQDPPGFTKPSFLTKFLSHVAFKPLPYPAQPIQAPASTDKVAFGQYLVFGLECYSCHSADFKKMNVFDPEKSLGYMGGGNQLIDLGGKVVYSSNLTFDETGIGKWSEADFRRAVRQGFAPGNRVIRYPMTPKPELTDDEVTAIYAYLRTVPKIHNAVPREEQPAPAVAAGDAGKQCYYKYGCVSCHGDSGVGLADLRKNRRDYPKDEDLLKWIRNAPSIKPDTKMPMWEGVIAEADYVPLLGFVRGLAQ